MNGFFYPLTAAGTLSAASMVFLGIHGLAGRNPYEILLSLLIFSVLLFLLAAGYLSSRKLAKEPVSWVIPELPAAGTAAHLISGTGTSSPPFFRLHFRIKGVLSSGSGRIGLFRDEVSEGEEVRKIEVYLPVSGRFHGTGRRVLRDVFGLVRFPAGPVLHRGFPVLPCAPGKKPILRIEPSTGAEEKQNMKNADEERFFMREYAPGDRFRDINWKTSSRLSQLMTRVSPQSQQKTRILSVYFRNIGPSAVSLPGIWVLDRMKGHLLHFLKTVREDYPGFLVRIITAGDVRELETEKDSELFAEDLAGLGFLPGLETYGSTAEEADELFVFSSSYDSGLRSFLGMRGERVTNLYFTAELGTFPQKGQAKAQAEILRVRDLFRQELLPMPDLFRRRRIQLIEPVRPFRGSLNLEYARVLV